MTTVTNSVRNEAGGPASNILVTITLLSSTGTALTEAFDGEIEINPTAVTRTDVEGVWTLDLYPNPSITPASTKYQVTHSTLPTSQIVTFVVPADGATPFTHHLGDLTV